MISIEGDDVRVRFLRGSEHVVTLDQVKPCSLVPGQRVMYDWPWWGPWRTTTCHVADVWLEPERKPTSRSVRQRVYATMIGVGGLGAIIGSIITALLMR